MICIFYMFLFADESEDKSTVIALAVVTGLSIATTGVVVLVSVYCVKKRKKLNPGNAL